MLLILLLYLLAALASTALLGIESDRTWLLDKTYIPGPPKLLEQPPEEVWFQIEQGAGKLILNCDASDNAEELLFTILNFTNPLIICLSDLPGSKTEKSCKWATVI